MICEGISYSTPKVLCKIHSSNQDTIKNQIQTGDIIFQTSMSRQSQAVQRATNSKFSHCGIIIKEGKEFYVFEAIEPVKKTPLMKWIDRGKNGKFVIKRLKNADSILSTHVLNKMKQIINVFNGKNYDLTFEWSDNKLYCSELIWKIYKRSTGIEIGKLEKLRDFNLTDPIVKLTMTQRYGNNIPLDETVISPASIYNSILLKTIQSN